MAEGRSRRRPDCGPRPTEASSRPPAARRLFLVLQTLFATRGVQGLEAWVDRARFEAACRGFDFDSPAMNWARYPLSHADRPGQSRVGRPPTGAPRSNRAPKPSRRRKPPP